jgi:hypothetical protein
LNCQNGLSFCSFFFSLNTSARGLHFI